LKRVCLHPQKASGFSLLEISVSMLLMSVLLLMTGTTLLQLVAHSKTFQDRNEIYGLAQNLMETLLSLPEAKAKALTIADSNEWTQQHRYQVHVTWTPYANPNFEKLTIEYQKHGLSLLKLMTLTPHHSSS
jgi:prepilin-type N-terminal cleavage/methylation domain-containing protein